MVGKLSEVAGEAAEGAFRGDEEQPDEAVRVAGAEDGGRVRCGRERRSRRRQRGARTRGGVAATAGGVGGGLEGPTGHNSDEVGQSG